MKGVGEESRRKGYERSLRRLFLFGGFLSELMQDDESLLDLRAQTLRGIEQAQEL